MQIHYSYEQDSYLSQIHQLMTEFDDVLLRLLHEKVYLDIVVVTADLRLITQFEEMTLLKEFEKRETTFTSRYRTKKQERQTMDVKVRLQMVSVFPELGYFSISVREDMYSKGNFAVISTNHWFKNRPTINNITIVLWL